MSAVEKVHYKVTLSGRVQGVGCRYQIWQKAQNWPEITGYVQNKEDGTVLIEVLGEKSPVVDFLDEVRENLETPVEVQSFKVEEVRGAKVSYQEFKIKK